MRDYLREAVRIEKSGKKVKLRTAADELPAELQSKFIENPALKTAFEALTP